jgi:DNA repair protein RecN (Recombination protein N)
MLERLFIRDFGLIAKTELTLTGGFTVFTGETGAGKSMLIDALSLALGARAGNGFIRTGAEQATIEATFALPPSHPVCKQLAAMAIELEDGTLTLRRVVGADGKTRCFANGVKITQSDMKDLGDSLTDIHGQHDHQMLLRPTAHPDLLDRFGGLRDQRKAVKAAYAAWRAAVAELEGLKTRAAERDREAALLAAYIAELEALDPQTGEETTLAEERQRLMAGEQLVTAFDGVRQALSGDVDVVSQLGRAERALGQVAAKGGADIEKLADRLSEVSTLVADVVADIEHAASTCEPDPQRLEQVEERLYALRDCARKHATTPDLLPQTLATLTQQADQLAHVEENMTRLEAAVAAARAEVTTACAALTKGREKAAKTLKGEVEAVLARLKMPDARFEARLIPLAEDDYTATGAERVEFYVATNPGTPFAPLVKAASGGEVSRLMLALKVVFYQSMPAMTLVFDEIDTGVGGAVAEAVGLCMADIAKHHQVFAITHQPQVAARGAGHIRIAKAVTAGSTATSVAPLAGDDRLDEIARMLSGAEVTKAAREAAASLLGHA